LNRQALLLIRHVIGTASRMDRRSLAAQRVDCFPAYTAESEPSRLIRSERHKHSVKQSNERRTGETSIDRNE
jgi:hypothetical protein